MSNFTNQQFFTEVFKIKEEPVNINESNSYIGELPQVVDEELPQIIVKKESALTDEELHIKIQQEKEERVINIESNSDTEDVVRKKSGLTDEELYIEIENMFNNSDQNDIRMEMILYQKIKELIGCELHPNQKVIIQQLFASGQSNDEIHTRNEEEEVDVNKPSEQSAVSALKNTKNNNIDNIEDENVAKSSKEPQVSNNPSNKSRLSKKHKNAPENTKNIKDNIKTLAFKICNNPFKTTSSNSGNVKVRKKKHEDSSDDEEDEEENYDDDEEEEDEEDYDDEDDEDYEPPNPFEKFRNLSSGTKVWINRDSVSAYKLFLKDKKKGRVSNRPFKKSRR